MSVNPFLLFALGVAASMLVIPLVCRVAPQVGLIDLPDPRKVHRMPVPRVGGWGITVGALVPLLLSFQFDHLVQSFVLGAVTLFMFGVWDDVKQLGHWTKFAGQLLAVGIVVWHGDLYVTRLPFLDTVTLDPWTGRLFTMFAVVGAINASNHSDGLDGLAGGEALLSLIAMAALGYVVGDSLAVGVALATIGGILGFLRYNSYPAHVFMGDAGSQVLGFTLGFLAVYLTQIAHTAISAALPLLLLGLPIADILVVLCMRIRSGGNWFTATRNHIHHRLLDLGFAHYETVIVIYSVHALLVVSAVLLRYESDWLVTAVYSAIVGTFFVGLRIAERHRFDVRKAMTLQVRTAVEWFSVGDRLRITAVIIGGAVSAFALLGAATAKTVPADFAIAAAVLAAVLLFELVRTRGLSPVARAATYAALIFAAYLFAFHAGEAVVLRAAVIGAMAALGVAVAAYIRCSAQHEFGTTPTDYLIVFGVLALMAFGSIAVDSRAVVALVAYAAVLLYAAEIIIGRSERGTRALQIATFGALAIMALRGAVA